MTQEFGGSQGKRQSAVSSDTALFRDCDLNQLVTAWAPEFDELGSKNHSVELRLIKRALNVRFQPEALKRVILALIGNAIDALPAGGLVSIETRMAGNDFAELMVIDTGIGMAGSIVSRARYAYFTTKANRAGMGLSDALAFAQQVSGQLAIKSEVGVGTVVSLLLPIHKAH
jgi:signal transduction histidine kinase